MADNGSNRRSSSGGNNGSGGRMTPLDRYHAEQERAKAEYEANRRAAYEEEQRHAFEAKKRAYLEKQEHFRAAKARRAAARRRVFISRLILFAVLFAIIFTVAAIAVGISFSSTKNTETDVESYEYLYVYDADDDDSNLSVSVSDAVSVKDGVRTVDFSIIADMASMTVVGSSASLKFYTGDEECVIFTEGSRTAVVNSNSCELDTEVWVDDDGDFWVPVSFVEDYMTGVSVTVVTASDTDGTDEKGSEVENSVTVTLTGDTVSFALKESDTIEPITEDTYPGASDTTEPAETAMIELPTIEFTADLSDYEQYMDIGTSDEYLILVNTTHTLDEDYVPTDLVDVVYTRDDGRNTQQMRLYAEKALEAMFIELFANGYDSVGSSGYPVSVTSGYRSYSYQISLFNSYVEREMANDSSLTLSEAETIVATYSARAGTSEHQTGLCADLHNLSSAQQTFANEEAYEWLVENCWKFGFILRFPEDKEDITGIEFEPWHYRYVGRYHAYIIMSEGLCLEEYVEMLSEGE